MSTPVVGFAVVRTRTKDGTRHVIMHWTADCSPWRKDDGWRTLYKDSERFTYALHPISGEPVEEMARV